MKNYITGEEYKSAEEIVDELIPQLNMMQELKFKPHPEKHYSLIFESNVTTVHGKKGIYFIYFKDLLIYIGQSNRSIGKRLNCLCAVLKGQNTEYETHSAGIKIKNMFEKFFNLSPTENLSVKFFETNKLNLSKNVSVLDVESAFIQRLNPIYNSEIIDSGKYETLIDLYFTANDISKASVYAQKIVDSLNSTKDVRFSPNYDSRKGVILEEPIKEKGFYCIYRYGIPIYVGYSAHLIRERLGKFCAVVRKVNRDDEDHIAAKKYRQVFGDNFDGLSVKTIEYHQGSDISVSMNEISELVAKYLDATFNGQIYRKTNGAS